MEEIQQDFTADAAGGPKRKIEEADITGERKMLKLEDAPPTTAPLAVVETTETPGAEAPDAAAKKPMNKAREIRLDQNRKAARESRRRKKTMIEELQRSVIFFSRANSTLKQQNDELSALLVQAQTQMANMEGRGTNVEEGSAAAGALPAATAPAPVNVKVEGDSVNDFQQAQAQAVATQAVLESQGFPAAAARAAAQTMNAGAGVPTPGALAPQPAPGQVNLAQMQPGATMQAMASFQQAAASAMQSAMQGMQGIPGVNLSTLQSPPVGSNPQQAYTDTMTAFAMQHAASQAAAAAAAGQQVSYFPGAPFMAPMMWPTQAAPVTTQQTTPGEAQPPAPVAAPAAPAAPEALVATPAAPVAAPEPSPVAAQPPMAAPVTTPVAPPAPENTQPAPTATA